MGLLRAGFLIGAFAMLCSSPLGVNGQFLALHQGHSGSQDTDMGDDIGMSSVSEEQQKLDEDDSMDDEQDDAASADDAETNVETGEELSNGLDDETVALADAEDDIGNAEDVQEEQENSDGGAVGAKAETESDEMRARDEAAARNEAIAAHASNSSKPKPGCCIDKAGCCYWPFDPEPRKKLCPCPKFRLWIDNEELPLRETKMSASEIAEAKRQMANAPPAPWAPRRKKSLLGTSRFLARSGGDAYSETDIDSEIGDADSADSSGSSDDDQLANMDDEATTSGSQSESINSDSNYDIDDDSLDNDESTGNSDEGESMAESKKDAEEDGTPKKAK